jgi:predicted transcriptional regulator of viral defense system
VLWLWSGQQGYFSHETALALHNLSDALPSGVDMTVPASWSTRRLRIPEGLSLHYADVDVKDTGWLDVVPLTQPTRTIADCIHAHVSPELIEQAIDDARERGVTSRKDARGLVASLRASQEDNS